MCLPVQCSHIFYMLIMRKKRKNFRQVADPGLHYFGKPDPDQSKTLDPDLDLDHSQNQEL
jgi:hypothetical protein